MIAVGIRTISSEMSHWVVIYIPDDWLSVWILYKWVGHVNG